MQMYRGDPQVDRKNTDDLSQELMSEADIDSYIKENQSYFTDRNVAELLTELYDHQRISKAELARRSGVSEVYLHQLFSGRRKPSRDKLLCLCVGMELTVDETQRLLKEAAYAQLYPPNQAGGHHLSTASPTTLPWRRSTTSCLRKMKRPCVRAFLLRRQGTARVLLAAGFAPTPL